MKLNLKAQVSRSDAQTIRHALDQLAAKGTAATATENATARSGNAHPQRVG
jgi:hypothetical protein